MSASSWGCEAHGVETLYRSDHYMRFHRAEPALEAWGTTCALAAITTKLRLGTLVSPITFRHPSVLAKLAHTADHISGGRIDVGVGTGRAARSTTPTASRSRRSVSGWHARAPKI